MKGRRRAGAESPGRDRFADRLVELAVAGGPARRDRSPAPPARPASAASLVGAPSRGRRAPLRAALRVDDEEAAPGDEGGAEPERPAGGVAEDQVPGGGGAAELDVVERRDDG